MLYHYLINGDRLTIGEFNSIACGAKFLFTSANQALGAFSTYMFPIFFEEWDLPRGEAASAWDNRGGIAVGNDVWIGLEAVILLGVTIGDGAIIGVRAVVTKDVPPYTIVGGVPAKMIRRRFDDSMIAALEAIRWWDWEKACVRRAIPTIKADDILALKRM